MNNLDIVSYFISFIFLVLLIILYVRYVKLEKLYRRLESDISYNKDYWNKREPYYVDQQDRQALAVFVADHMNDTSHPNHADMVRILSKWSSSQ